MAPLLFSSYIYSYIYYYGLGAVKRVYPRLPGCSGHVSYIHPNNPPYRTSTGICLPIHFQLFTLEESPSSSPLALANFSAKFGDFQGHQSSTSNLPTNNKFPTVALHLLAP